jgi:hypothetical protein
MTVRPGLDEVDDSQQEHRPVAELEHVADVDRRGHVSNPEAPPLVIVVRADTLTFDAPNDRESRLSLSAQYAADAARISLSNERDQAS